MTLWHGAPQCLNPALMPRSDFSALENFCAKAFPYKLQKDRRNRRLNSSRYRNEFCITRCSDVSSFLRTNFVFPSLGVHPKKCVKDRYFLSTATI